MGVPLSASKTTLGSLNLERRDLHQVDGAARPEHRAFAFRFENRLSSHLRIGLLAEADPETLGEFVEVFELGVAFVVAHQHDSPAGPHPLLDGVRFVGFDVFRVVRLQRRVRINDDEHIDTPQRLRV